MGHHTIKGGKQRTRCIKVNNVFIQDQLRCIKTHETIFSGKE